MTYHLTAAQRARKRQWTRAWHKRHQALAVLMKSKGYKWSRGLRLWVPR